MGLIMLKILETIAAIAIIHIPSIYMLTGKSANSSLCSPIIQATNIPTTTPMMHEFNTRTKD